jgi:ParB/RepB/Spo0J family partition protein
MPNKTAARSNNKGQSGSDKRKSGSDIYDIQVGRTNLFSLKPDDCVLALDIIDISGKRSRLNVRDDMGDLDEFAESLRSGIRVPLRGYMGPEGEFHITDGERRWRGAKILAKKGVHITLPVIREPQKYSPTERTLDLLRTNNGKPLDMLEKAHAFRRLTDVHKLAPKEIAAKSGYSTTHVTDCLLLLQAAPEVQEAVKSGEMKATLAVDLVRQVSDKEKQRDILAAGREKAGSREVRAGRAYGAGSKKTTGTAKVTAKSLPIATGKKARVKEQGSHAVTTGSQPRGSEAPLRGPIFERQPDAIGTPVLKDKEATRLQANMLDDLLESVSRNDCMENAYETAEMVRDYLGGETSLKNATKFLLGM